MKDCCSHVPCSQTGLQALLQSRALERSAVACCCSPALEPAFAALLEAVLGTSTATSSLASFAGCTAELGLSLAGQPPEMLDRAHASVGAAMTHLKQQAHRSAAASSAAPSGAKLASLEAAITQLGSLIAAGQSPKCALSCNVLGDLS